MAGSVRRLTEMPNLALFMAWSPNSEWIVYTDASLYMPEGAVMEGIWAISVSGDAPRKLYEVHMFEERILGWTSIHSFLVESTLFESPSKNLREVNVVTGEIRTIYEEPYGFVADFIPEHSTAILNASQIISWFPDIPEGLYALSLDQNEPSLLVPGSHWGSEWSPELERIIAEDRNFDTRILTLDGEVEFVFPETSKVTVAPDGQWFLTSQKDELQLRTHDGEIVQTIGERGNLLWLPDSTGFYRNTKGTLYLHLKDNQWEGQLIDQGAIHSVRIINP